MSRAFRRFFALSAACLAFVLLALVADVAPSAAQGLSLPGGSSQESAAPGGGEAPEVSAEQIEDLIATLEAEGRRSELISQLRALAEARQNAAKEEGEGARADGLVSSLTDRFTELSRDVLLAAEAVSDAPELVSWVRTTFGSAEGRNRWLEAAGKLLLVVAAGLVAELAALYLLKRPRRIMESRTADRWVIRVPALIGRAVIESIPIAAFAVVAGFVLPVVEPRASTARAAYAIIEANVIARLVLVLARAVLAPYVPGLRIPAISDGNAHYGYVWVRRFANVAVYGYFLIEAARHLGMPEAGHVVLLKLLGLVVTAMGVVLVLQTRQGVAGWIEGDTPAEDRSAMAVLRRRASDVWHVVAIIYLVVLFCVWLLDVSGGFVFIARATLVTVVVIGAARLASAAAGRGLRRLLALRNEDRALYPALEHRANRHMPIVYGTVRLLIWLVALIVIAQAWGLDTFEWVRSPAGRETIATIVRIAIVVVGAVLLLTFVSSAVERYIARSGVSGPTTDRATRLRTLLPLARNALAVVTVIIGGLIVLSQLGLDIGPLLAGAGVIGLAIGFGSQKLVQDVINGMFLLIEDTVQVGDVVAAGGYSGLCEAITIRTLTLRGLDGTVYTVPFSEVSTIENLTKEFSFAMMDVGVAYREDTDEVVEILQKVAEGLREDEQYKALILEPLEVLGVDEFADSAVIIKVRMKTLPIKQWTVKREFNRRMKKAFDEAGIEIPFPHTTLYFGVDKEGRAPPANVRMEELLERQAKQSGKEKEVETPGEGASSPAHDEPGEDRRTTTNLPE